MKTTRIIKILTVLLSVARSTGTAGTVDTYWRHDPATPGDWHNTANWTNGVPVYNYGDCAYVDNGGTAEISYGVVRTFAMSIGGADASSVVQNVGTDVETAKISIGYYAGTTGAYELNGGEFRWKYGGIPDPPNIGYNGTGTFRQTGGTLIWKGMSAGTGATGDGLFELTGGAASTSTGVTIGSNGVFRQTGGSFNHYGSGRYYRFRVDDGGQYELSGDGWFYAESMRCDNPEMGGVVQSGGTSEIVYLKMGTDDDETGTYLLTAGGLTTTEVRLGYDGGTGVFRQTGGAHASGTLHLGSRIWSNRTRGTYELAGGDLIVDELRIGDGGWGTFKQTGGTNSVDYLYMWYSGRYEYTGGTFELTRRGDLYGTFDLMGAGVTVYVRDGAWLDLTDGHFANAGAGTLDCRANSVTVIAPGTDLGAIFGTVNIRGAIHTEGETFLVPAGGTIATSGEIVDHVRCEGVLTHAPDRDLFLRDGVEIAGTGSVDLRYGGLTINDTVSGMSGGQLSTGTLQVGAGAKFTQSAGSATVNRFWLYGSPDEAVYELSGGDLVVTHEFSMGGKPGPETGVGRFVQTGGTVTVAGDLDLARLSDPRHGTYELVDGQLSADFEVIGAHHHSTGFGNGGGHGLLHQEGGSNSTRIVAVGHNSAYELTSGQLEVTEELMTWGRVSQSGGTAIIGGELTVKGSTGLYELSGGILTAGMESVGEGWGGNFIQTGGTNTIDSLTVRTDSRYELSGGTLQVNDELVLGGTLDFAGGAAELSAGSAYIASSGTGTFTQTGGKFTINDTLAIAHYNDTGIGSLTISGGELNTAKMLVVAGGGSGLLVISNAEASITVSENLYFGANSSLSTVPRATIHMTGSAFENESTDPVALAGLKNLRLIFEGGTADTDPFEVAGQDKGGNWEAFHNNFTLGALQLGGGDVGQALLVDNFDNQPGWMGGEALYVRNLQISAGSQLDLSGVNLYCLTLDNAGTILYNGGTLTQVPPIDSINATYLDSGFVPTGGAYGIGELTIGDEANTIVESAAGQTTYDDGSVSMITSLFADHSADGLASGEFRGGELIIKDSADADLLTGDLISLELYEVIDGAGILAGQGLFEVTGGSLEEAFLLPYGDIVQITFQIDPADIDDFSVAFTGFSNITLTPVPEPATLSLLALGGLALIRRRRR